MKPLELRLPEVIGICDFIIVYYTRLFVSHVHPTPSTHIQSLGTLIGIGKD